MVVFGLLYGPGNLIVERQGVAGVVLFRSAQGKRPEQRIIGGKADVRRGDLFAGVGYNCVFVRGRGGGLWRRCGRGSRLGRPRPVGFDPRLCLRAGRGAFWRAV